MCAPDFLASYSRAIFDCDGVLLDSNPIKSAAFAHVLADAEPSARAEFIAWHESRAGVSRYVKFGRWYEHYEPIADRGQRERAVAAAAARFSAYARERLAQCPLVPGVPEFLARLARHGIEAVVVSGADQAELEFALVAAGLREHFSDALGSPTDKATHLTALRTRGWLKGPALFFGDAAYDREVAKAQGLDFVLIYGASHWREGPAICASAGDRVARDFTEL